MVDTSTGTHVEFRGVSKTYDGRTMVVQDLDLRVGMGEFFTLLGPSGRNLSTTLRHRRFLFTDSFLLLWKWRVG